MILFCNTVIYVASVESIQGYETLWKIQANVTIEMWKYVFSYHIDNVSYEYLG